MLLYILFILIYLFQHCVLALTDYRTTKLETRHLKTEKMGQKLSTNIINSELLTTETSNPDESISKLEILLEKLNKSKMKLFNAKNILDKQNTVDTVFNVQHDKLNSKFIKRQSCCLSRKTKNIKISARLKREAGDFQTCACQGPHNVQGTEIKNIVGGEGYRRLKILVRI
jgi:hypothetical protein